MLDERSRWVIPVGVGFVVGMLSSTLAVVALGLIRRPVTLGGQLTAWPVAGFIGAVVAQWLGARLSAVEAGFFGLLVAVVHAFMALNAPRASLAIATAGAVIAAMVGAHVVRHTGESRTTPLEAVAPPLGPPPTPGLQPRSFAERTGQSRRLRVAHGLTMLGGAAVLARWLDLAGQYGTIVAIVGTAMFAVGLVGECLAVWCPRCGTAVVWHTFLTRKAAEAQLAAVQQPSCPKCGYEPE